MARELRRLLLNPERLQGAEATDDDASLSVALTPQELHYLQRVLRLRDGDALAIGDGIGHLWRATLQQRQAVLQQPLAQPWQQQPAPGLQLQLAMVLPRRDSDVLLRMATELGVDRLQPLLSQRSVLERWNASRHEQIVREAVEQCERLWSPQLGEPLPLAAWLPLTVGVRFWATTRQPQLPHLTALLPKLEDQLGGPGPSMVTVAIGPEGGWTANEDDLALSAGWQPVQLGATILRCSTAAVAAASLLCSWRAGLG